MKTLALVQGDLSLAPGGYLMLEGAPKIHQDLSLALKEEYGADHLHPKWGSILQNYVGSPLTADTRSRVLSEINRVIANYITVQNARIVADTNNNVQSKTTTDDIVQAVSAITAQELYDNLLISVTLLTLSNQTVSINQVVSP